MCSTNAFVHSTHIMVYLDFDGGGGSTGNFVIKRAFHRIDVGSDGGLYMNLWEPVYLITAYNP